MTGLRKTHKIEGKEARKMRATLAPLALCLALAALDKAASPWEVTLTLPGAPAAVRFDAAPEGADNFNTERR